LPPAIIRLPQYAGPQRRIVETHPFGKHQVDGRRPLRDIRPALERVSDVPLLQWLEVLRDVRRIPATSPDHVVTRVAQELRLLAPADRRRLIELACQQTPPRGRALLGALLENIPNKKGAAALRQTLNPLTTYRIGVSAMVLPNRTAWHIR
jgi:hypothetical protein